MEKIEFTPEAIAEEAMQAVEPYRGTDRALAINSIEDCAEAAGLLAQIKGQANALDKRRREITKPLDEAKARIMDLFREPLAILSKAEAAIKSAVGDFNRKQEEARIEADRVQREIAKKEEDRLRKLADKAEARGDLPKAQAFDERANLAQSFKPGNIVQPVSSVAGISVRKAWKYRIVDAALIPREYVLINETLLGNIARSTKGELKVPGVEFYADNVIASSARSRLDPL